MRVFGIFLFAICIFSGCKDDDAVEQQAEDDRIIQEYISSNNLQATAAESGLYYVVDQEGTGDQPNSSSSVRVVYRGELTDGTVFDQSDADGLLIGLNNVISGWQIGIPKFKEGGKGILLIPSHLGYGRNGSSGIPSNAVLIFHIDLKEVL